MMNRHRREVRTADMPAEQLRAYSDLAEQIVNNEIDPFHPRDNCVHLAWLSSYAAATGSLDENKEIVLSKPSAKVHAAVDLVNMIDDTPTVVFTTSLQLLYLIRKTVLSPRGRRRTTVETHESHVAGRGLRSFINGSKDILFTTTHRPIGLNYSRARRAVFLQRPLNPGAVTWIESALPDDCEIVTLVSAGTVECLWPYDPNRLPRLAAVSAANPESVHNLIYGKEE